MSTSQTGPQASSYVGRYEPMDATKPNGQRKPYRQTDKGVAIIDVLGSLVNRGSWLDAMSGLSSYDKIGYSLSFAVADPSIKAILLDIDSPGGEAIGAFETGDAVRAAAMKKPTMAVVNGMAASAAYAIAAGANRIITTKSGLSGSIGVVMLHMDHSRRLDQAGVTPTLIHAGARKVDGNPYEKLSDEVKAELKAEIDRFYSLFVSNVAQYRTKLSEDKIRATEARTFIGADAVAAGIADEVGTFESVLTDLSGRSAVLRPSTSQAKRSPSMTEQTETVTRAEMDAAVVAAIEAERARIRSILTLAEAKGRETLALHLATNTSQSSLEVQAVLGNAPSPTQQRQSQQRDPHLGLVLGPNPANEQLRAENHGWDEIVDRLNAQHRRAPKRA